jgi:hypothetical protein
MRMGRGVPLLSRKRLVPAILLVLALASCGGDDEPEGNGAAGRRWLPRPPWPQRPARLGTLTGLYRSDPGPSLSRLCILPARRSARFGIVVSAGGGQSCSGSGRVTRDAGGLRFSMAGESACTFHASVSGRTIIITPDVSAGCSYYCGSGARLVGARLTQTSTRRTDAMKATDLVGEPLCSEE